MDYPFLNACLNSISTILLVCGFVAIKKRRVRLHKKFMLSALCTSALFLTFYLIYHYQVGDLLFQGQGTIRTVYFVILIPHVILAMLMLPMILMTFFFIFRGQIVSHKKIARWTFPIWLYVSITGVILYVFMYQMYPEHLKRKAKENLKQEIKQEEPVGAHHE